jgi:hypothetical protein
MVHPKVNPSAERFIQRRVAEEKDRNVKMEDKACTHVTMWRSATPNPHRRADAQNVNDDRSQQPKHEATDKTPAILVFAMLPWQHAAILKRYLGLARSTLVE